MKKLIIILGTVLLGVYIVNELILGGATGSGLEAGANKIVNDATSSIDEMILQNGD